MRRASGLTLRTYDMKPKMAVATPKKAKPGRARRD
jgi:hypothetical protein